MVAVMALLAGVACRSEEPRFEGEEAVEEERSGGGGNPEPRPGDLGGAPRPVEPPPSPVVPAAPPTPVAPPPPAAPAGPTNPALLNPAAANERAPARFAVELDTTKGPIIIDVTREWAPNGADRFYNLVRIGYFTDVAMFRVIEGFMAQGGIHGDPAVNRAWRNANIPDDPRVQSNTAGMVSYAMAGPGTRTTQFFVSFGDNSRLDGMGFAPFGRVRDMAPVQRLHAGYGEGAPRGRGPMQGRLQAEGNAYLRAEFPQLDYIRSARIL
jgi:peptidyl-prolyl cis-trans isomerase A (cyclophilin A)